MELLTEAPLWTCRFDAASGCASELGSVLYARAGSRVEVDGDGDELALTFAVVEREAVRVLHRPLVCHLARVSQDVEQRDHRDDRRRAREQHQDAQEPTERPLGEAQADGIQDVIGRVDADEPCETRDDDSLADHHEGIAPRLGVAATDNEVPVTLVLTLTDQCESGKRCDGHQHEAGDHGDGVHDVLQYLSEV